jgi:hypothetical protein
MEKWHESDWQTPGQCLKIKGLPSLVFMDKLLRDLWIIIVGFL